MLSCTQVPSFSSRFVTVAPYLTRPKSHFLSWQSTIPISLPVRNLSVKLLQSVLKDPQAKGNKMSQGLFHSVLLRQTSAELVAFGNQVLVLSIWQTVQPLPPLEIIEELECRSHLDLRHPLSAHA